MTTAAPAANNVATPFVKSYTGIKSVLRFTTKEGQTVEFKHHAKDVYLYLLGWEENKGVSEIYPSRSRIAEETGYSLESVKRALKFLKEHGFISIGKKTVHSVSAGVSNTQEVNLYTVASLQEALAIISGEGKGNKNAASRPARKGKPQLHVVQDQEQPNDDHSDNSGDPVQHDVTDSEQPDVMPVVINTTESTEVTEPQNEGVSVDSILPVDDCDHDDGYSIEDDWNPEDGDAY